MDGKIKVLVLGATLLVLVGVILATPILQHELYDGVPTKAVYKTEKNKLDLKNQPLYAPFDASYISLSQCSDGIDNDGDGKIDYAEKTDYDNYENSDSKCSSPSDNDESPRDFCEETDRKMEPEVQGTVSGDDESVPFSDTDFCISPTLLNEYRCGVRAEDYAPLSSVIECNMNGTTRCINGACQ